MYNYVAQTEIFFSKGKHDNETQNKYDARAATVAGSVSCGSGETVTKTTTAAEKIVETTAVESAGGIKEEIPDDLPERDFKGKTFTVLTYDYIKDDYVVEKETGDVVSDAIYQRDQNVSERFNANINYMADMSFGDTTTFIRKSVMAADDEYQLIAHHAIAMGTTVMSGYYMNLLDIPYIDFEKPWWSRSTLEDLTYGNDLAVFAVGDYSLSSLYGTYCYFYDKKAAEDYHFDNLYDVVNDGKWTIDYVKELCKPIYIDLNGNAEKDAYDYYGLTQSLYSSLNTYFWAFGGKIFTKDESGIPELTYKNERTAKIFEEIYNLCFESDGVICEREQYNEISLHDLSSLSFRDNLSALASGTLNSAATYFRDKQNEYGILPYPKPDETQKEYRTMVDGNHAVLAVPKTVQDTEFAGIMTEALNAESHKLVIPAYYEIALKKKYTYDDESVRILDMIVDSRVFDFGYIFDAWQGMSFYPENIMTGKNKQDFESYYAKNSNSAIGYYKNVMKALEKKYG